MKTKRNWIAAAILAILLTSLASPLIASSWAEETDGDDEIGIVPETDAWYRLESDMITVLFPRGGSKPMFIWWYTKVPDQVYVVKYHSLIEYFAFDHPLLGAGKPEYYGPMREAWHHMFERMYMEPEEHELEGMGMMYRWRLELLWRIMKQIGDTWHSPVLPFNVARWTLSDIKNITTPDERIIGISFAFKLVDVPDWMPNLQFAENNIMIKVRFYNETVEETVPGTDVKYTVNAGEMKMDFVVNKWVWNIDAVKQLIQQLQEAGLDVQVPEGKSKLALRVDLASINVTRLPIGEAEEHPEEIEEHSTLTHVEVEDAWEDVRENKTVIEGVYPKPIEIPRPLIKLRFANETTTLGGFFRFVSSAKITEYPNVGDVSTFPVKAAYISGGAHMRLFIGYPYFGNGTLEHDPSIGVDTPDIDASPKYTVQAPTGSEVTPVVLGKYRSPLVTTELMIALVGVASATAIILYVVKWKRKTPVNMVGGGTTG